jgi:glycosyltransferase involved in cell wall biosynthesis
VTTMKTSSERPLISVLLPTYNGADTLENCLEAIMTQDYPNFEVVITDDNSHDASAEISARYASRYPNIRLHVNKQRLGLYPNVCYAASLAKGPCVHFAEQDDLYEPTFLSRLGELMEANPDAGAVSCTHVVKRTDGTHCYDMYYAQNFKNSLARAYNMLIDIGDEGTYGEIFVTGLVKKGLFIEAMGDMGNNFHSQIYTTHYALAGPLPCIPDPLKIKFKTPGGQVRHQSIKALKARWYYPFVVSYAVMRAAIRSPHVPLATKIGAPLPLMLYTMTHLLRLSKLKINGGRVRNRDRAVLTDG